MNTIKKKEDEETEEIIEETKEEKIFDEEESKDESAEPIEVIEKPKRKRTMTPAAKAQLDKARLKSNASKRKAKEDKLKKEEENRFTNEKYINEIENLKNQVHQLLNPKEPEPEIEPEPKEEKNDIYLSEIQQLKEQINELKNNKKVVIKESKPKTIQKENRFSMDDLQYYADEYYQKMQQKTKELKNKNKQQLRNRYFYDLR